MPTPSPLGTQIEEPFAKCADYITHPAGHSEYLLRYRTATGIPFAIGRTASSGVRIWMSASDRFKSAIEGDGFACSRSEPKPVESGRRGTGRNSNLDQIPEFKGKPLCWTSVTTPGEALAVASKLR